ncbi:hypothetical protein M3231_27495 [Neobacillus mesonae]|nr:hypothetical protein [Neobacillus mesonae]
MKQVNGLGINASIYIHKYKEQVINSRSRPIIVIGLDQQTITFLNDLVIPPVPELRIGLVMEDMENTVHLHCSLEWKQELGSFTMYHAILHIHEEHRLYINGQLHQMVHRMRYPIYSYFQDQLEEWTRISENKHSRINTLI